MSILLFWEESQFSFWVTFLSFALGFVSLFLPVSSFLLCSGNILFRVCFGPWMMLVDYYFVQENLEESIDKKASFILRKTKAYRRLAEEVAALKAMRNLTYGKFSLDVPLNHVPRHFDRPTPESTATPLSEDLLHLYEKVEEDTKTIGVSRQTMSGKMIYGSKMDVQQNEEESATVKKSILARVTEARKKRNYGAI